jgi:hypothetical protein
MILDIDELDVTPKKRIDVSEKRGLPRTVELCLNAEKLGFLAAVDLQWNRSIHHSAQVNVVGSSNLNDFFGSIASIICALNTSAAIERVRIARVQTSEYRGCANITSQNCKC